MDMMAAGTSAPMTIAAKQNPVNHGGNILRNSWGTASFGVNGLMPAARAISPRRAINPRRNVYAGKRAALRLMACPLEELRMPVMVCGYTKAASAEPKASVAYAL